MLTPLTRKPALLETKLYVRSVWHSQVLQQGLINPFPTNRVILSWDPISDLHDNDEHSIESVEGQLKQNQKQIVDQVLKWREEVTNQLVAQYMLDSDGTMEINSDLIVGLVSVAVWILVATLINVTDSR